MIIFLTGMPGVGKSYWGEKLAAAYGLPFADLDSVIESGEGAPIPALFGAHGEDGFRLRETKHLQRLISAATGHLIIACGGGTPCYNGNMELMKNTGTVIYLEADAEYLISNLHKSPVDRPLLHTTDIKATLIELFEQRKKIYEQAHHILSAPHISFTNFDQIFSACIGRH